MRELISDHFSHIPLKARTKTKTDTEWQQICTAACATSQTLQFITYNVNLHCRLRDQQQKIRQLCGHWQQLTELVAVSSEIALTTSMVCSRKPSQEGTATASTVETTAQGRAQPRGKVVATIFVGPATVMTLDWCRDRQPWASSRQGVGGRAQESEPLLV